MVKKTTAKSSEESMDIDTKAAKKQVTTASPNQEPSKDGKNSNKDGKKVEEDDELVSVL